MILLLLFLLSSSSPKPKPGAVEVYTIGGGLADLDPRAHPCDAPDAALPCLQDGTCPFIRFKCSKGHVWKAIAGSPACEVCPRCSAKERKKPTYEVRGITDCPAITAVESGFKEPPPLPTPRARSRLRLSEEVARRGGQFVTPVQEIEKLSEVIELRCAAGHTFSATASKVSQGKAWCPTCRAAERKQEKIAALHDAAQARGGEFLENDFRGMHELHRFRCEVGHEFDLYPANLLRKEGGKRKASFCSICKDHEMMQSVVYTPEARAIVEAPWSYDVSERETWADRFLARNLTEAMLSKALPTSRKAPEGGRSEPRFLIEEYEAEDRLSLGLSNYERCREAFDRVGSCGLTFPDPDDDVDWDSCTSSSEIDADDLEFDDLTLDYEIDLDGLEGTPYDLF